MEGVKKDEPVFASSTEVFTSISNLPAQGS